MHKQASEGKRNLRQQRQTTENRTRGEREFQWDCMVWHDMAWDGMPTRTQSMQASHQDKGRGAVRSFLSPPAHSLSSSLPLPRSANKERKIEKQKIKKGQKSAWMLHSDIKLMLKHCKQKQSKARFPSPLFTDLSIIDPSLILSLVLASIRNSSFFWLKQDGHKRQRRHPCLILLTRYTHICSDAVCGVWFLDHGKKRKIFPGT